VTPEDLFASIVAGITAVAFLLAIVRLAVRYLVRGSDA
jgi:hypothetical protein